MRAYRLTQKTGIKLVITDDLFSLFTLLEEVPVGNKVTIEALKVTKEEYQALSKKNKQATVDRVQGIEFERKETVRILNLAYEKYIGDYPKPDDPLYLPLAHFKRQVVEELEKNHLVWETKIRKEYETSPHWKYSQSIPPKRYDTWGYEKD